jgi:hypothetical protein
MARKRLGSKNATPTTTTTATISSGPTPTRNLHDFNNSGSPTSSSSSSSTTTRCDGDDSSSSVSPGRAGLVGGGGGGGMGCTLNPDIHQRHSHRYSHQTTWNTTDEEVPSLLFPVSSSSSSSSSSSAMSASVGIENSTVRTKKQSQGQHQQCRWCRGRTIITNAKRCWRVPPRVRLVGRVMIFGLVVPFIIERMVFSVRYMTMSRPAILYGSPMDWKDVRGCLKPSYRHDVRDFQAWFGNVTQRGMKEYDLPLNPNMVWNWYRYSNRTHPEDDNDNKVDSHNEQFNKNGQQHQTLLPQRRLLVAQYSGFGSYSQILQSVSPINRAYCKKWGHDYVTLEGTALHFPGMKDRDEIRENIGSISSSSSSSSVCNNKNFEPQSTFNKIPLLFRALEDSDRYDQVLILDTDTMIVDFDYDISRLLLKKATWYAPPTPGGTIRQHGDEEDNEPPPPPSPPPPSHYRSDENDYFLVAYRVWSGDWKHTWDVNAGISLWNLRHPSTAQIAELWLGASLSHPVDVLLKNDDQFFLQRALIAHGWRNRWGGVRAVRDEFEYYEATVIKHFKRDARSWSRTSLEQRLLRIEEAKINVCKRWSADCESIIGGGAV